MTPDRQVEDLSFNLRVAQMFRDFAALLELQDANLFRVNAYIRAAVTLESLGRDVRVILRDEGPAGLIRLPTIGRGLAASIEQIARSGRFSQLDRLRGTIEPRQLFRSVPGIGKVLSQKIFDTLHIDTLESLELAAHDGSLDSIPGIGARKLETIRAGLEHMLKSAGRPRLSGVSVPSVSMLLDVDAEYRSKAAAGSLPKLAPKRFNPAGEAWLPLLHAQRASWHFSVLFSNTARAHELDKTRDWVVIYCYDDDLREAQYTVVTETHGDLRGRRVVRGRESECSAFYAAGDRGRISAYRAPARH